MSTGRPLRRSRARRDTQGQRIPMISCSHLNGPQASRRTSVSGARRPEVALAQEHSWVFAPGPSGRLPRRPVQPAWSACLDSRSPASASASVMIFFRSSFLFFCDGSTRSKALGDDPTTRTAAREPPCRMKIQPFPSPQQVNFQIRQDAEQGLLRHVSPLSLSNRPCALR